MGTKLEIWKQGQFYPELGKKIIELPYQVNPGPSDQQVKIEGFNVQPDDDGNFLYGNYAEEELDAIHTYGIVRMVIDLYEGILKKPIIWSWRQKGINKPLNVRIRNNGINSRYLKDYQTIELDYYGPYGNWTYNCRTVDLVAHETGHAVIDSLKPEWEKGDAETRGMAEAFCDLTAMFLVLIQKDLCKQVIGETQGDLTQSSILSQFGVGHGFEENSFKEIRNALNNSVYKAKDWNTYRYCEVLVGILYELLIDFCSQNTVELSNFLKLKMTGENWLDLIVNIFSECDKSESSLDQFYSILKRRNPAIKDNAYNYFRSRKVF